MKTNIIKHIKFIATALVGSLIGFMSCTDNFEDINTNPNGVPADQVSVESRFSQPMQSIYLNYQNRDFEFQILQNLNADSYSGYMANPTPFGGNNNNSTYLMNEGWNNWPLKVGHLYVMKPISIIKESTTLPDYLAMAKIIQVASIHRVTDTYGPMPYSKAMTGLQQDIPYDSQQDIYYSFFTDLNDAINSLTEFVDTHGDDITSNRIASFDQLCGGSYTRWIRFANTLRLRLAMHIVKVDPDKAKTEAEAAVNQKYGVLTSADRNIEAVGQNLTNPLHTLCFSYNDSRVSASFTSILDGLNDPRLPKLVYPIAGYTVDGKILDVKDKSGNALTQYRGKYIGVRQGIIIPDKNNYVMYANIRMPQNDKTSATNPLPVMKIAEAYFLRAEGALRNWNMGGTAQELYTEGIKQSFADAEVTDSNAFDTYLNDDSSKPADYVDPFEPANNIAAISKVTVKWNESATQEEKLEKIITQKWIAMFPEGQEAWTEFRRTGYPKLFPVAENRSGGIIPNGEFVKRLKFTSDEYDTNKTETEKAATLLNGGVDNINTRLWWDVNKANF